MGTNPLDHSKFKFYSHQVDEATETIKLPQLSTKISRGIDGPKERFYYGETDTQPKELNYQGNFETTLSLLNFAFVIIYSWFTPVYYFLS